MVYNSGPKWLTHVALEKRLLNACLSVSLMYEFVSKQYIRLPGTTSLL